jgi:endo-1,4-beta-xylanase
MKQLKSGLFLALLACAVILIMGCPEKPENGDDNDNGISLEKEALLLTVFTKEKLKYTISGKASKNVTWTSSDTSIVTVDAEGTVKAVSTTEGEACSITVQTEDGYWDRIMATITLAGQVDMMTLPPMKDQFANYFKLGNIASGGGDFTGTGTKSDMLKRHFNVVTAENIMKPSYYNGSRSGGIVSGLTFSTSNSFVNAAKDAGFEVHGHVLLWHRQNSTWINNIANESNSDYTLAAMKDYITKVMGNFKGRVYSWDVLNEAFPDGVSASADWTNSIRKTGDSQAANPWFVAIGSDFVYEGFKAARLADPDAILYYNDYNLNEVGKSTMVRDMVKDVNNQWKNDSENTDKNRLLIEGIGMQSHHNTRVTASAIKTSLDRFKPLGVIISISELDVLCSGYDGALEGAYKTAHSSLTNEGRINAANLYYDYFKLFIQYKDIIERVTFWGLFDYASWRSGGLPLPFEGTPANSASPTVILAKPAYYKIMEALE